MFNVGDFVFHQKSGHCGKVVGYGHEILNGVYETTLKVLVAQSETFSDREFVEEDLHSAWGAW